MNASLHRFAASAAVLLWAAGLRAHDRSQRALGVQHQIRRIAAAPAKIAAELAAAARAPNADAQAAAFRDVLSGAGAGRLAFGKIVKVLIQLADPADLAAEFFVQARKDAGARGGLQARYLLGGAAERLAVERGGRDERSKEGRHFWRLHVSDAVCQRP